MILQLKEHLQQERKGFGKSDFLWDYLGRWGNSKLNKLPLLFRFLGKFYGEEIVKSKMIPQAH